MKRSSCLALCLLVSHPLAVTAQGYLLRLDSRAQTASYRGVSLDSIPRASAVPGTNGGLETSDGFAVDCPPGSTFCTFYRPGAKRRGGPLVTSADLTAWGLGLPRLSLHANARLGVDLGTTDVWPGTDPAVQLLEGYLDYSGDWFSARAGRQTEQGRLGYTGFDGGALAARKAELGLSGRVYLGLGLARGTALPVTSPVLNPLDDFQPRQRQLVFGTTARWQLTRASLNLEYRREVDRDPRNLVSERVALSGSILPLDPQWRLTGGGEYDLARGEWGTADVDLSYSRRTWGASAGARYYRPYFDLWTIWGVFSPVPYTAANGSVWLHPVPGLELDARGEHYRYSETFATTPLVEEETRGWRWSAGAGYAFHPEWHAGANYHAEFGPGASSRGWDANLSWRPVPTVNLSADGGRLTRPLEFRFDEAALTWVGLHVDIRPSERLRLGAGLTHYAEERRRPDAAQFDWDQTRLLASVTWLIGSGADRMPLPPARRRGSR